MTMIVEFLLVSSNQNATNVYRLSAREKIRTLRNDATLECGRVPITPARNCLHLLTDLLVISHNGSLSTGNLYSMQPQIPNWFAARQDSLQAFKWKQKGIENERDKMKIQIWFQPTKKHHFYCTVNGNWIADTDMNISHRCRVCCVKHSVVQIKGFMYRGVFVTAVVFKRIFSLDDDLSQKKATKKIKIRFHSTIHCGLAGNKTEACAVIGWFPIDYWTMHLVGTLRSLGKFRCAINLPISWS